MFQSVFFSLLKTNMLTRLFWVLLPNSVHCTGRNQSSNRAPKSGVNPPNELPVCCQARGPIWYRHFKDLEARVSHGYKRGLQHFWVQAHHTEARMVRDAPVISHLLKNSVTSLQQTLSFSVDIAGQFPHSHHLFCPVLASESSVGLCSCLSLSFLSLNFTEALQFFNRH